MPNHPAMPGRLLAMSLPCLFAMAVAAQPAAPAMDGGKLGDFRQEAEAFNRQDPFANAYRAGYYNGYLAGVLDALQGSRVCFRECVCELDKLVGQHLAAHPQLLDRPVAEWLVPLLERSYPCGK